MSLASDNCILHVTYAFLIVYCAGRVAGVCVHGSAALRAEGSECCDGCNSNALSDLFVSLACSISLLMTIGIGHNGTLLVILSCRQYGALLEFSNVTDIREFLVILACSISSAILVSLSLCPFLITPHRAEGHASCDEYIYIYKHIHIYTGH